MAFSHMHQIKLYAGRNVCDPCGTCFVSRGADDVLQILQHSGLVLGEGFRLHQ